MILTNLLFLFILVASLLQMNCVIAISITTIQMFLNTLFPSLFFSLVLCKLLLQNGFINLLSKYVPFLRYNTIIYGIFGSLLGFAGNALLMKEAYDKQELSQRDLESVTLCFCIPSLSFFFTIGALLGNLYLGLLLYIIQLLFSFLVLLFQPSSSLFEGTNKNTALHGLKDAIASSGVGLYMMLGFILFTNISISLLSACFPFPIQTVLHYMGEFASACVEVTTLSIILPKQLLLLAFILGFGSISVHMQIYALLPVHPSYLKFLFYRILQSLFSAFCTGLFILKFLN